MDIFALFVVLPSYDFLVCVCVLRRKPLFPYNTRTNAHSKYPRYVVFCVDIILNECILFYSCVEIGSSSLLFTIIIYLRCFCSLWLFHSIFVFFCKMHSSLAMHPMRTITCRLFGCASALCIESLMDHSTMMLIEKLAHTHTSVQCT